MHDSKDNSRRQHGSRIGLGAAFQFVGVITQQVLRFGANWIIAHFLGPGANGLFSLSVTSWSSVEMSFSGGLIRAIMRYLPHHLARDERAEARGVVRLGLYVAGLGGVTLGALLYVCSDFIATTILKKPETAPLIRIMALVTPLDAISTVMWATARALGSFTFIVYQFMVLPTLFLLFIAIIAILQGDPKLLAWAWFGAYLLPLIPLWSYHNRLTRTLGEVAPHLLARPFLAFAGIGAAMWLAEFIARNIDLVLVGRMGTLAEAGIYAVASRNATLCSTVMISINAFFMPTISSLHSAGRMDDFRALFRKGTLWILIVGAPLAVYAMAFSQPMMLFFGRSFGVGAWALWLLAAAQLFNQGTGLIASALLMANRQHGVLVVSILGLGVTTGLCLLLIPLYGFNGAAMAMAASVIFVNLTLSVWGYLTLRLSPLSSSYFKPLVAAAAAGILSQIAVAHLPLASVHQAAGAHVGKVLLTLLVGMAVFAPLYLLGMLALGAKEEALTALAAVRSGLNRRNQVVDDAKEM